MFIDDQMLQSLEAYSAVLVLASFLYCFVIDSSYCLVVAAICQTITYPLSFSFGLYWFQVLKGCFQWEATKVSRAFSLLRLGQLDHFLDRFYSFCQGFSFIETYNVILKEDGMCIVQ